MCNQNPFQHYYLLDTSGRKQPKTKQPDEITDDDYLIKKISELRPIPSQPSDQTPQSKPKRANSQTTYIETTDEYEGTTVSSKDRPNRKLPDEMDDETEYNLKLDRPLDELDEYCITTEYIDRKTTKETSDERSPVKVPENKLPTTQKAKPKPSTQPREESPHVSEYTDEYYVTTTTHSSDKKPKGQKPFNSHPGDKTIPLKPKDVSPQKTYTTIETTDYVANDETTIKSRNYPNRKSPDREYGEPEHVRKPRPDKPDEYSITIEYPDRKPTSHSPDRSPIKDSDSTKKQTPNSL
ncbi:hypothetical protein FQR65_LT18947 [Abscondita terminalis]|nr:hypothetical protein FQR65_LT18947 [Abscondita terminalis]